MGCYIQCVTKVRRRRRYVEGRYKYAVKRIKRKKTSLECHHTFIRGKICDAGIDFVDILKDDCTVITILRDSIRKIKWLDDCHPFDHHNPISRNQNRRCRYHHLLGVDPPSDASHSKGCHHHCCSDHGRGHDCCCDDHGDGHHSCDFTCLQDFAIPVCDHRTQLRMAGLTGGLSFQFLRNRGCEVIIECA